MAINAACLALSILLVEDDALIRMVVVEALAEAGHRVSEAANAAEALKQVAAGPPIDVLVTDVRMPGSIDGFALAHIVSISQPSVGLVIFSGHAEPQPGDLPVGAAFLAKPFRPAQLIHAVEAAAARSALVA